MAEIAHNNDAKTIHNIPIMATAVADCIHHEHLYITRTIAYAARMGSNVATTALSGAARFLAAAQRRTVDRAPVWLMRQAGRYLPEYMALRRLHDFVTCCTTPELATEISLQPWRRFGVDGVVVFCDILMPLAAMGLEFSVPDGGPRLSPIMSSLADVHRLKTPDASTAFSYLTTTLSNLRSELNDRAAVIGFCGAPWTVALYMITGGAKANRAEVQQQLLHDEKLRTALFDKLVPMLADYLTVQIQAGAQIVQIFDTWAGLLSTQDYERFALPVTRAVIERVRAHTNRAAPITIFCQQCAHLLPQLVESGADVVSIDARTNLQTAREQFGHRVAIQGNLDPEILLTTPETIRTATRAMLAVGGTTGYIANLGHGIDRHTPVENVAVFVKEIQNGS